jgi:hypothetical protein
MTSIFCIITQLLLWAVVRSKTYKFMFQFQVLHGSVGPIWAKPNSPKIYKADPEIPNLVEIVKSSFRGKACRWTDRQTNSAPVASISFTLFPRLSTVHVIYKGLRVFITSKWILSKGPDWSWLTAEKWDEFQIFGDEMKLKYTREEIKSKLNSRKSCYHLFQFILSYPETKIKIHQILILFAV